MKKKLYIFDGAYVDLGKFLRRARLILFGIVSATNAWRSRELSRWTRISGRVFTAFYTTATASFQWTLDVYEECRDAANGDATKVLAFVCLCVVLGVLGVFWATAYVTAAIVSTIYAVVLFAAVIVAAIVSSSVAVPIIAAAAVSVVLLACAMVVAYVVALTVRGTEWVPLLLRGVRLTCPRCGNRWQWPRYFCQQCGQLHEDLWPGVYGLLYHGCDGAACNARVPAMLLTGRNSLRQECRKCTGFLHADLGAREIHLAVVGARSSGKSNFIAAGMPQLVRDVLSAEGYTASIADPAQLNEWKQWRSAHSQGRPLDKTHKHRPPAFTMLCSDPAGHRLVLYIYDASGEVFENQKLLSHEANSQHHRFVDGLFLIVDPFAERENVIRFALSAEEERAIGPADRPVSDVFERLLEFLEKTHGVRPGAAFKIPLAVVVTKADGRTVLAECGGGVDVSGSGGLAGAAIAAAADSPRVRAALSNWGVGSVIELAERRFQQVAYFVCSSLGRSVGSTAGRATAFIPRHMAAPFAWLIYAAGGRTGHAEPIGNRVEDELRRFRDELMGRRRATIRLLVISILCGLILVASSMILIRRWKNMRKSTIPAVVQVTAM